MRKLLKRLDMILEDEILMTEFQILNLIEKIRNKVRNDKEEQIVEDKINKFYNRYNLE